MRGPQLAGIVVSDNAEDWEAVGFQVNNGLVSIGTLTVAVNRPVTEPQWWFEPQVTSSIHGIGHADPSPRSALAVKNTNGANAVDHIVVITPNLATTTAEFEEHGFELRRSRPRQDQEQRFFWAGTTIIEVVGPAVAESAGPAHIWGLALVSDDLDASKELLGDRMSDPKEAVQPGRRIAAIRTAQHKISVTIALMSPHH
ncbi:MAG: VOC family protein [Acidimicrobiales bacterium]